MILVPPQYHICFDFSTLVKSSGNYIIILEDHWVKIVSMVPWLAHTLLSFMLNLKLASSMLFLIISSSKTSNHSMFCSYLYLILTMDYN